MIVRVFFALALATPAIASAQSPPQHATGPVAQVAWLSGTWSCSVTGMMPGQESKPFPSLRATFTPSGAGLKQHVTSADTDATGTITYEGGRWTENTVSHSPQGQVTQSLSGSDVDVRPGYLDLSGAMAVGKSQVQVRSLREQTGKTTYKESGFLFKDGDWVKIAETSCKRQ